MKPRIYYVKKHSVYCKIRKAVTISFVAAFLFVIVGTCYLTYRLYERYWDTVVGYYNDAVNIVRDSEVQDFRKINNSYVYANDGTLLTTLHASGRCSYVEYDDLPEDVINAYIAIEDRRFRKHDGVDWLSTCKAGVRSVFFHDNSRGGSTITQQLARNMYLTFTKSYERKLREIFIALQLEQKYSKEQVMEFYVNNINYSNGCYGIGAAAKKYFGKSIDECSTTEIAFLCAIPNNPAYYNPFEHFDHVITRRNTILGEMYRQNFISKEEWLSAKNSPVKLCKAETEDTHNYESGYAIECAVHAIMKASGFKFKYHFKSMKAYDKYQAGYALAYEEAMHALYNNGYVVKTSVDLNAQARLQEALDDTLFCFKAKDKNGILINQGAATVIDNVSGKVIAIVGGRSQKSLAGKTGTLNRAYQSYRQPGSTIKPVIVYAPSFERGYTPDSIVDDTKFEGGPRNSGDAYLGKIPLRTAVEKSKNVVAWKLFTEMDPSTGLSYAEKMNFSKITPNDYFAPAALGGLYYGVSTVEMAGAYATLANKGVYRETTCIVDILDLDYNSLYSESEEKQVYTKEAAETMTDVLTGVAMRGTAAGLTIENGMPVACKTGTTNKQVCGWFCGYTPYYTCAVYVGADDGSTTPNLWGGTYPCTIWKTIQEYLCKDKLVVAFDLDDIRKTEYETSGSLSEIEDVIDDSVEDKPVIEAKPESVSNKGEPEPGESSKGEESESSEDEEPSEDGEPSEDVPEFSESEDEESSEDESEEPIESESEESEDDGSEEEAEEPGEDEPEDEPEFSEDEPVEEPNEPSEPVSGESVEEPGDLGVGESVGEPDDPVGGESALDSESE